MCPALPGSASTVCAPVVSPRCLPLRSQESSTPTTFPAWKQIWISAPRIVGVTSQTSTQIDSTSA